MAKPEMYATLSFMLLTADIILPVPSSIVMYLNGYVTGIIFGTLLSFFSLLAGSIVGYYIGRFTSGSLKSTSEKQAGMILSEYGVAAILMTRGIPVLSEALCIVCGYNRMPLKSILYIMPLALCRFVFYIVYVEVLDMTKIYFY
ncbi:MAG: VTT domain-containing protein [Saprospiraceae bacterium]|nr:VTT domain-containing protein [Saprospiraceae bacterium]